MKPALAARLAGLLLFAVPLLAGAAEWRPLVSPYGELFPSLVIATAGLRELPSRDARDVLGDRLGLVGASVVATRDDEPVRLVVRVPGVAGGISGGSPCGSPGSCARIIASRPSCSRRCRGASLSRPQSPSSPN